MNFVYFFSHPLRPIKQLQNTLHQLNFNFPHYFSFTFYFLLFSHCVVLFIAGLACLAVEITDNCGNLVPITSDLKETGVNKYDVKDFTQVATEESYENLTGRLSFFESRFREPVCAVYHVFVQLRLLHTSWVAIFQTL